MTEPQNPPPYPPQQPGQWQQQPPPPKKRKKWPFILGGIIVLIIIIAVAVPKGASTPTASSGGGGATAAQNAAAADAPKNVVTYEVTGPAKASVTYMSEGFQTAQVQDAKLPFKKDIQFSDDVGKFSGLSLVAQNGGTKGDITCRILVDGKQVATNTSSGAYSVVTCTGANI